MTNEFAMPNTVTNPGDRAESPIYLYITLQMPGLPGCRGNCWASSTTTQNQVAALPTDGIKH